MKQYKFTLANYFDDDEMTSIAPIIENFVACFADDNGVATLNVKDDVRVVVKRDEGAVFHMAIDNDDFVALPKSLTRAKDFAKVFINSMAKAVDEKRKKDSFAQAKSNLETKAESDLLSYIGATPAAPTTTTNENTTVVKNGKVITDPAEKQKVADEIDATVAGLKDKMRKIFSDTFVENIDFTKYFDSIKKYFDK